MEEYKINEHFLNAIYEIRGKVLQSCIDLEMVMDTYISEHFCETPSKVFELISLLLSPRVAWREKLIVFTIFIEKYNTDFLSEYPEFSKDITNIIEHRNVFAHLPADITSNGYKLFTEKGIASFLKFKNAKLPKTNEIVYMRSPSYTNEEINSILKGINTYTGAIQKMLRKIK